MYNFKINDLVLSPVYHYVGYYAKYPPGNEFCIQTYDGQSCSSCNYSNFKECHPVFYWKSTIIGIGQNSLVEVKFDKPKYIWQDKKFTTNSGRIFFKKESLKPIEKLCLKCSYPCQQICPTY